MKSIYLKTSRKNQKILAHHQPQEPTFPQKAEYRCKKCLTIIDYKLQDLCNEKWTSVTWSEMDSSESLLYS